MANYSGHLLQVGTFDKSPNVQPNPDHRHTDGTDNGDYPRPIVAPVMGSEFSGTDFPATVTVTGGTDQNMIQANHNSPSFQQAVDSQRATQNASGRIHNAGDDARKLTEKPAIYLNENDRYPNIIPDSASAYLPSTDALQRGLNSVPLNSPFTGYQKPAQDNRQLTEDITRLTNSQRHYDAVPQFVNAAVASNAKGSASNAGSLHGNYFPSAQTFQIKQIMTPFMFRNPAGAVDSTVANDTTDYTNSPSIGSGF